MLAPTVFFNRTQALLKLAQSQRNMAWILVDPTLGNLLQRNGVDVMKFLTAAPKVDDQICLVEQAEMFAYCLATHVEVLAKLVQGLAIFLMQSVEQKASARIGQGFEDSVHSGDYVMQPNGCMSMILPAILGRLRPPRHGEQAGVRPYQLRPAENSLGENRRCPWNSIRLRAVARRYRIAFPFQVKRARSEIDDAMISVENFRSQEPGNWRRAL